MGDQAYRLFCGIPAGLLQPETLLRQLNVLLLKRGHQVRLESVRDLKTLDEAAALAAIELIPTLKQTPPPSAASIASLL